MSVHLFNLIKTLSKAEKRVFSENIKKTKRMRYYTKLITVYSKHETYSSALDLKVFKSESPKFISDCKTQCRHLLYDCLVTLEKNKGIKKQVAHKFKIALMLKNRKQYEEAKRILEKIDKLATKYELLEELVQIKTQKIIISVLIGADKGKFDMDYMKALALDKNKAIQHFVDVHHAKDDVTFASINWHLKKGAVYDQPGSDQLDVEKFKNLSIVLARHQRKYCEYMGEEDYESALDEVKQVIHLTDSNKDIVLEAELLSLAYANYVFLYVELCIIYNRKIDIELIFKQFDSIPSHTIKDKWNRVFVKMVTSCMYALSLNKPKLAVSEIQELETFRESTNYLKYDNSANVIFPLFVYFADGNWEECLSYIDIIEINTMSPKTSATILNIKLICIYEEGDIYYFNSLINQHRAKKRKNGIKINNHTDINDYIFCILCHLTKNNGNVRTQFREMLKNFDHSKWVYRFMIHWVVGQIPELSEDEDYLAFLAQHNYTHYDFKAYKKENGSVFSLDLLQNRPQTT